MLKKTSFWLFVCFSSSLLFFITGCTDVEPIQKKVDCQSPQHVCINLNSQHVQVSIDAEFIMVESMQTITFKSSIPMSKAQLIAVNMNMGTVPLYLNPIKGTEPSLDLYEYKAPLYLGMCAKEEMNWDLVITLSDGTVETIPVSSYWNRKVYESLSN